MRTPGLLAGACETIAGYFALGNDVVADGLAGFVRNPAVPDVYDANQAVSVRAATPGEADAVLGRAEAPYAACRHRQFLCDALTPAGFEARLVQDGYLADAEVHLVLEGELRARPGGGVSVRAVETAADWAAVGRLTRLDHEEEAARPGGGWGKDVTGRIVAVKRGKCPPLRFWLAALDGTDCGFFSSWSGDNGVGKVEDLFTDPDFRGRGVASALIASAGADARERGAGPVLVGARPDDTPRLMYAAMGFRPLCLTRAYRLMLG